MIISHLPETSALFRLRNPDSYRWGLGEQLLAMAVDTLRIGNWMRTKDGQKGRKRPEPIPRPGVQSEKKTFGTTVMSIAEADAWLAGGEGITFVETGNDLMV